VALLSDALLLLDEPTNLDAARGAVPALLKSLRKKARRCCSPRTGGKAETLGSGHDPYGEGGEARCGSA
jgi:hypothetical protein